MEMELIISKNEINHNMNTFPHEYVDSMLR